MDATHLIASLQPERGTPAGEATFTVDDPATGAPLACVANGSVADAEWAVDAAAEALPAWSATPPRRRAEILQTAHRMMMQQAELLSALVSAESGKSHADAAAEIGYAAEFFRWFGEEAVRCEGEFNEAPDGGSRSIVTSRPVGVAALVTPWNFPAAMVTRKLGPALAAGCTTLLKPAAETPLTAMALARLLTEAGVPAGVVNVVPTDDPASVVTRWLEDPRVRKLSFTGSTGVGRSLLRQAADRVLNTSMELGGNAAFIVAEDADVESAVAGAMIAKFRNSGQACTAANRFFVHASRIAEFTAAFEDAIGRLRVGPASAGSDLGPLISVQAQSRVHALVEQTLDLGARASATKPLPEQGYFCSPVILSEVPEDAPILQQEIFGPVAPVVVWDDVDDLLERVNGTELGLASYVYAGNLKVALQLAERIEAGMVGVNRGSVSAPSSPFGGVKQSGLGREGARDGIRSFQETQFFSLDWT